MMDCLRRALHPAMDIGPKTVPAHSESFINSICSTATKPKNVEQVAVTRNLCERQLEVFAVQYSLAMQIKVLSNDRNFVNALAAVSPEFLTAEKPLSLEVGKPTYVPGAVSSWWELLAALGVIGLPVGVAGNLIASWIWNAFNLAKPEPQIPENSVRVARLVLREGEKVVDVHIEATDQKTIEASIVAAITHVLN